MFLHNARMIDLTTVPIIAFNSSIVCTFFMKCTYQLITFIYNKTLMMILSSVPDCLQCPKCGKFGLGTISTPFHSFWERPNAFASLKLQSAILRIVLGQHEPPAAAATEAVEAEVGIK